MQDELKRYLGFSEDDEMQRNFDPEMTADPILAIHGSEIRKSLCYRNPVTTLRSLIGYQILATSAEISSLRSLLKSIFWILVVAVAINGYVAYKLT